MPPASALRPMPASRPPAMRRTFSARFADTRAYEWLTAYAAEYGFVLRWPEERQAATGMVYEPWHWRYVGVENALAIRASGLSLEEFLALERTKL